MKYEDIYNQVIIQITGKAQHEVVAYLVMLAIRIMYVLFLDKIVSENHIRWIATGKVENRGTEK